MQAQLFGQNTFVFLSCRVKKTVCVLTFDILPDIMLLKVTLALATLHVS